MTAKKMFAVVLLGLLGTGLLLVGVLLIARPSYDTLMCKGKSYLDHEDYDSAILAFTDASRTNLRNSEPYYWRAIAYRRKGDLDKAIADCTEVISLAPTYSDAYAERARTYEERGDFERAITDFGTAIGIDGRAAHSVDRGWAYAKKGELERAFADTTEAIRIWPEFAGAYLLRGFIHEKMGNLDKAIAEYTEAIRLDPMPQGRATYCYFRGHAFEGRLDLDKAIADYSEAIRLDPKYAAPYAARGSVYAQNGETVKAREDFAQAKKLSREKGGEKGDITDFGKSGKP